MHLHSGNVQSQIAGVRLEGMHLGFVSVQVDIEWCMALILCRQDFAKDLGIDASYYLHADTHGPTLK